MQNRAEARKRDDTRTLSRRRLLARGSALLGAPGMLTLLAACQPSTPAAPPAGNQAQATAPARAPTALTAPAAAPASATSQVTIVQLSDPTTLDPHDSNIAIQNNLFAFAIFDGLTRWDATGQLQPWLATSWKLAADMAWEFELRSGVKFHNGDRLDADTVKGNFDRILAPDSKVLARTVFGTVDHVNVLSPQTVQIVTKQPDPLLPRRLAAWGSPLLPPTYLDKVGLTEFINKPVGTGMYRMVEWVRDSHVTLQRNPDWWGNKPAFETVTVRTIPSVPAAVSALLNGEVDIIDAVPVDQAASVDASGKANAVHTVQDEFMMLMCNVIKGQPVIQNRLVRQAMSYALDRESLARNVYAGFAKPSYQVVAPTDAVYDPKAAPIPHDPDRAKSLLQQAGYKGEVIDLWTGDGIFTNDRALTEAMAAMFEQVGMRTKITILEPSVYGVQFRDPKFPVAIIAAPSDQYFDPDGGLYRLLLPGGLMATWDNQQGLAKMAQARTLLDQDQRWPLYRDAMKSMLDDLPWIPLVEHERVQGVSKRLDWKPRKQNQIYLEDLRLAV